MKNLIVVLTLNFIVLGFCKEITFEEGLQLLYKNNAQLKVLESKLIQAKYKKFETFSSWLPKATIQAQYTKLSQPQMDISKLPPQQRMFFENMMSPTLISDKLYSLNFNISQLVFSSGKIYSAYRISCLNYEIAKYEYEKTKQDLEIQYKEMFLKTLLAKKVLEVQKKAVEIAEENYKVSSEMYKEGRVSYLDYSSAKLNYSNAKISLLKMKNSYELAKEGLKNLLCLDTIVEPVGELESFYKEYSYELKKLEENIKDMYEIKIVDTQRKILVNNLHIVRTESLPIISLIGNYSWTVDDYERNFDEWDDRYNWVVVLNWPIFSSGATFSKYKQARENVKQVEIAKKQLFDGLKLQLSSLYLTYQQLQETLKLSKENLDVAEENYKVAKNYYLEGRISYIELLQAELSLSSSKVNYYQSLAEYIIICEKLKKFGGVL
ncbi:MAG: TolC family protein [Endomicrobia bacterium]|nr:TolC family protein [Endomicrobiia bacterium]MDW8056340.1 TolC family protein [Elusimicrobiota bacterium]